MAESSTFMGVDGESKAMLEVATPDLYRINAFRVLGLSVDVSSGDSTKQQRRMKMLEKLGEDASQDQPSILPLDPSSDADAIRKAGQRLHDPESRIVDELFWFWPVDLQDSEDDSGLNLMQQGNLRSAHHLWSQLEQDGKHKSVAAHNLAVLHHALALDMEHNGEPSDPKLVALRDKHWQVALKYWGAVLDDDVIWDRISGRIRDLDNPRLKAGVARRLRHTLPAVALTISIRLAVRSAQHGNPFSARRHLTYICDSGLDPKLMQAILDREVTPLVDQIKRACEPITAKCKADPEHADVLAQQLISDTKPLLTGICVILDEHHHLRESASDAVAGAVRNCMIDYGNKTDNWERCAGLLRMALAIASDEGMRARLQEDIAHVEKNRNEEREYQILKNEITGSRVYDVTLARGGENNADGGFRATVPGVCTCCLGKPDGERTVSYEWQEFHGGSRYRRRLSFAFPICAKCRRHRTEYSLKCWLLAILAAGGSTAIAYLVASQISPVEWLPFVLVGSLVTAILLLVCSRFVRLSVLAAEHACRAAAVEMSSASNSYVTFRFHNPLYADAFAKANHAEIGVRKYTKPPRGSYLLRGRAAIFAVLVSLILGVIGHSIVFASMQDDWKRKSPAPYNDYAPSTPENTRQIPPSAGHSSPQPGAPRPTVLPTYDPTPRYSPPRTDTPRPTYDSGLSSRIDAGKSRAKVMESEIASMDKEMDTLSSVLAGYKNQIDGYERQVKLRLQVDQAAYELAIENHNSTVKRYNALLADRKAKYAEYSSQIDSVNDMVRRYNSEYSGSR